MKKALLFLTSMLVGATAFAQSFTAEWPKNTTPEFKTFAVEDTIYLWNVGTGGFYINHQGGDAWPTYRTHASVNDTVGTKVIFTRTNPDKNQKEDWTDMPDAYLLVSYVTKFSSYHCTFASDGTDGRVYTDNNGNVNRYWTIQSTSGNYFKIVGDVENNSNAAGLSLGAQNTAWGKLVFHSGSSLIDDDFSDEWAAVSKEAYEAWYSGEERKNIVACYKAAEALKEEILKAQEKGHTAASLADYYAVYNNLNSTAEELAAAKMAVWEIWRWDEIKDVFDPKNITVGEKNDISDVFDNNNFDNENTDGWDLNYEIGTDVQNLGYQGATHTNTYKDADGQDVTSTISKFIEAWRDAANPLGNGSITQSIPNMPQGKYVLSVDANAQHQDSGKDVDNVQLFAQASSTGAEYYTAISTPNDFPRHFEFTFIHTGGSMTMGLRTVNRENATNPANWIAMDNLELYYYGDEGITPEQLALQQLVDELAEKQNPEEIDEVTANAAKKTAYTTAFATADDILENGGDYVQATTDLQAAYDALVASIEDYKTFATFLENADERVSEFEGTAYAESVGTPLEEKVGIWHDAYDDEEYDKEDIDKLEELLAKEVTDRFPAELTAGDDLTPFIANANFNNSFFGWSYTDNQPAWGGRTEYKTDDPDTPTDNTVNTLDETPITSGCAEVYQKKFSLFQAYKGLPAGVYQLRAQMFERDDDKKGIETYLYAVVGGKEQSTKSPYQTDYATEEKLYDNGNEKGEWPTDATTEDGMYVPHSMIGAAYHFAHTTEGNDLPDYTTTLNFVLNEKSDVEFGVKNTSGGDWVIFDNFQLIYLGEDLSAYLQPVEAKLAELEAYITENEDNVGNDVKDNLAKLQADILKLQTKEDCATFTTTIEEAFAYAKKSVELYPQAEDLIGQLETAKDEDDANQTAAEEAGTYLESISENVGERELTVAELEAVVQQCKILLTALKLPEDFTTASDEKGIDVTNLIVNPSFETGDLNGWTWNTQASGDTGAKSSSDATYAIDNADGSYVFNTWHGSLPEGGFWVSQTINQLPAGTYKLEALLAADKNSVITLSVNDAEGDFKMENPKETGTDEEIIFKLEAISDIEIKATSQTWFKADNFRLTYFGTNSEKNPTEVEEINVPVIANGQAPMFNLAGQQVGKGYKGFVISKGKKFYNR